MTRHYQRQIDKLKQAMLELGDRVSQAVEDAILSVERRDTSLAARVMAKETEIDLLEVEIEEECLHTLALYQPVASDLRFVVALVTINKDLERIADLAANLAEQAIEMSAQPPFDASQFNLVEEARQVREIMAKALRALVTMDADLAQRVRDADASVDRIHRRACLQIEAAIIARPSDTPRLLQLMRASRQLERIADHAVAIAEDVFYMVRGEFLRHRSAGNSLPGAAPTREDEACLTPAL